MRESDLQPDFSVFWSLAFGLLLVTPWCGAQSLGKPNVVILLADDLGFADLGFRGSDIKTPHIDRLAAQGVRLDRFYACPMCSPTRAGLLTGRWPIRFGLQRAVIPPWSTYGLPADEPVLSELLAGAGYTHRACVGKWHLGHARRAFLPPARGFTLFHGHCNGAIDYFTHEREGEPDWHRDRHPLEETGYSTDLIGRAAAAFVDGVPAGEPYFLYVPFNAPHSPFQASESDLAHYPERSGRKQTYAAMVHAMDRAIGQILTAVARRADAADTLVWFFSDNGGVKGVADNRPLRGHKLTVFEGGVRVGAVVRWPEGGLVGGKRSDVRAGYIDIAPTLCAIAGAAPDPAKPFDGRNLLPALRGEADGSDRPWFSYLDQGGGASHLAVHTDRWKLVARGPASPMPADLKPVHLFAIGRDPNETRDVAADHPEIVERLMAEGRRFLGLRKSGVGHYAEGRKGFVAPRRWIIQAP